MRKLEKLTNSQQLVELTGTIAATRGAGGMRLTICLEKHILRDLEQGFLELQRCLQPGGVLAVGFLPKAQMDLMHMPSDLFAAREPEEVASAAKGVGFSVEARQPNGAARWKVLVCRKAS